MKKLLMAVLDWFAPPRARPPLLTFVGQTNDLPKTTLAGTVVYLTTDRRLYWFDGGRWRGDFPKELYP